MSIKGIAKEGYPFILMAIAISIGIGIVWGPAAGLCSLVLPGFVIFFFRDPQREIPQEEGLVLSPADGRVLSVEEVEEGRYLRRRLRRVCIFLSILDVHVNRTPIAGQVKEVRYRPGRFLIGFAEKASLDNEQNGILIQGERGREVLFVQIAGFVARRIVCYLKGGERVTAGERIGLIRFGSRVDLYLPLECELLVKVGDHLKGGESRIGRFL